MTRLEYRDAKSAKFWEIRVSGAQTTTQWGRIGTDGQSKTKDHGSVDAAESFANKQISSKRKKGYSEVTADAGEPKVWSASTFWDVLAERLESGHPDADDAQFDFDGPSISDMDFPNDFDVLVSYGTGFAYVAWTAGHSHPKTENPVFYLTTDGDPEVVARNEEDFAKLFSYAGFDCVQCLPNEQGLKRVRDQSAAIALLDGVVADLGHQHDVTELVASIALAHELYGHVNLFDETQEAPDKPSENTPTPVVSQAITTLPDAPEPKTIFSPAHGAVSGGDARRSGQFGVAVPQLKPGYAWARPGYLQASAVLTDGKRIYALTSRWHVLDASTGDWLWSVPDHKKKNAVWGSNLVAAPDAVYAVDDESRLYAFHTETGEALWAAKVGKGRATDLDLSMCDDLVYVLYNFKDGATLHAFDRHRGKRRWKVDLESVRGGVHVVGRRLIVQTSDTLVGLDRLTGTVLWRHSKDRYLQIAVDDAGRLFASQTWWEGGIVSTEVHEIDPVTGAHTQRFRFDTHCTGVSASSGRLYVASADTVHCLDTHTWQLRWSTPVDAVGYGHLALGTNALVVRSETRITALDPDQGGELWSRPMQDALNANQLALSSETVFVLDGANVSALRVLPALPVPVLPNGETVAPAFSASSAAGVVSDVELSSTQLENRIGDAVFLDDRLVTSSIGYEACLAAVDLQGSLVWRLPIPANWVKRVGDDVLALEQGTRLHRVSRDGEIQWTLNAGAQVLGGVHVHNGVVTYGAKNERVTAANVETGVVLWSCDVGTPVGEVAVYEGTAFAVLRGGGACAVDLATGALRWRVVPTGSRFKDPVVVALNGEHGAVLVTTQRSVRCFGMNDGSLRWTLDTPFMSDPKLRVTRDALLVVNGRDLTAVALADGQVLYKTELTEFASDAMVMAGVLVLGASDCVFALRIQDGALLWKEEVRRVVSLQVVVDGRIAIVDQRSYQEGSCLSFLDGVRAAHVATEPQRKVMEGLGTVELTPSVESGHAGGGPERTGCYAGSGPATVPSGAVWSLRLRHRMVGMPVVDNGTVFFVIDGGFVFALDAKTGVQRWILDPVDNRAGVQELADTLVRKRAVEKGLVVSEGVVHVNVGRSVFRIDAETGKLLKKSDLRTTASTEFLVARGTAVFGTGSCVAAFGADGKRSWELKEFAFYSFACDGEVVVVSAGGQLRALSLADGTALWEAPGAHGTLIANDWVIHGGGTGVCARQLATGELVWKRKLGQSDGPFAVSQGNLWVHGSTVRVLDLGTGQEVHTFVPPGGLSFPFTTDSERAYFSTYGGVFMALNSRTGAELWRADSFEGTDVRPGCRLLPYEGGLLIGNDHTIAFVR